MSKTLRAIGLMSGTSMDGIDVALIETDGESRVARQACITVPYDPTFRSDLAAALGEARSLTDRAARPGCLAGVEQELTRRHAAAVAQLLAHGGMRAGDVEVVGFHGQTVLHAPERRLTVQIGDGPALARQTGLDVVYDLRAADVAAGGQGAPLAPVYHRALTARLRERPMAVVNIGGVGNVTWIGRDGTLIAFDTGPGNALIDDWMLRHTGSAVDAEGGVAARGRVDEAAVTAFLTHDYFGHVPPKSLDRGAFGLGPVRHLSLEDGAATLVAFTAASIARARAHFPEQPRLWVICGGGRRNKTLMAMVAAHVESAVAPAEAAGFDGDSVEAEAWAYMAVRSLKGLPITFPGTTGVKTPLTGGVLARR
ncbi:MAG: anhydro-N-acetylmuramic acid kinase [Hyphomonadaceae bacterium]|nr:anhydro-N-acetylmuramic acid kinase [Hyphomonadaceae bacterium]